MEEQQKIEQEISELERERDESYNNYLDCQMLIRSLQSKLKQLKESEVI